MNLRGALLQLKENIQDCQILKIIAELKTSIEDELEEGNPQRISEKALKDKKHRNSRNEKRSLLPFVGTALKVFGVSTERY